MQKLRRITALLLAAVMCLTLCGCGKKRREREAAMAAPTPFVNTPFEVKITMDNLFDYFYYKEYRSDVKGDDGKILSCQISYGLQLKETYTAANDPELKDTMKIKFRADGVVMHGDYQVDFNTMQYSGMTTTMDRTVVSETLSFWPKGDRTSTWAFGNLSTSYILYFENFTVTEASGSVWLKMAEPKEDTQQ